VSSDSGLRFHLTDGDRVVRLAAAEWHYAQDGEFEWIAACLALAPQS
jgi:hypothetical protein